METGDKFAAGYCRVSGRGQINGTGWDRQEEAIRHYAKQGGYTLQKIYFESHTGTESDRPEFTAMIQNLIAANCHTIIIESLDRLARDLSVQMQLMALLIRHNLTLISATTGQDVTEAMKSDPMLKAMVQIQGVFAELEKSLIVKKLSKARAQIRKEQGRCEGRKPYGYYPGEQEILSRIKQLARKPRGGDCLGYYQIASVLNHESFKSRTGKHWTGSAIRSVLSR